MAKNRVKALEQRLKEATEQDRLLYELALLVEKANCSDGRASQDAVNLRKFFSANPGIWKCFSSFAQNIRHIVSSRIASLPGQLELLNQEYADRRDRLGYQEASPLEQLLIERVMLCWLRLLWAEAYATEASKAGVPLKQEDQSDRLLNRAHNRYVKACESLAKMRAMEAMTKAATAQAEITDMKAKTLRAHIEVTNPGLLSGQTGPRALPETKHA